MDQTKGLGHGLRHLAPKDAVGLGRHRHEVGMADVGTQDPARGGMPQTVQDALGAGPGDAHHRRETEALGLVSKDVDNALELVQFDGIELAVRVGGVDAVNTGRVQRRMFSRSAASSRQ